MNQISSPSGVFTGRNLSKSRAINNTTLAHAKSHFSLAVAQTVAAPSPRSVSSPDGIFLKSRAINNTTLAHAKSHFSLAVAQTVAPPSPRPVSSPDGIFPKVLS
ncbi:MAG: hypothetical protein NVV82_26355 [Sporocytophaga sp.]|nr:hypothetical protein [Sporocytophaga sp.]